MKLSFEEFNLVCFLHGGLERLACLQPGSTKTWNPESGTGTGNGIRKRKRNHGNGIRNQISMIEN